MPAMAVDTEENRRPSFFRWFLCQCRKITLVNDRLFLVAPLLAMGSSLSEIVVVFSLTGFANLDMIAVSSVCLCLLLAFATLLFIRFDRLTFLAYLVLCVSLLSSSTFMAISLENHPFSKLLSSFHHPESTDIGSARNGHHIEVDEVDTSSSSVAPERSGSRHGRRLFNLMKSETELRWIHQIQSKNKCCGFWNYSDWVDPNRSQDKNTTYVYLATEPISPPPKWVTSCCDRTLSRDNNKCRSDSVYDDWKDVEQYLFQEGCGELLDDGLDVVHEQMLKTSMGLVFWDFLILMNMFIYSVWRQMRGQSEEDFQRNANIRDTVEEDDVFT